MKKVALTNYYNFTNKKNNDHICPHCSSKIKKWALTQCSSCNRFFCRSHMEPSIGPIKKCPGCRKHQQDFIVKDPIFSAMKMAENKISELRIAEKENLEGAIFASIFGNKDLIRFAEEQETQENLQPQNSQTPEELTSDQPITETETEQEIPQAPAPIEEPEQIDASIDAIATKLESAISQAMKDAGIFADENGEVFKTLLNTVLASENMNLRTAQKIMEQMVFTPEADIAAAVQIGSPFAEGRGLFTPQQARQAENYFNYLKNSGALNLEPEYIPGAIARNNIKLHKIMEYSNIVGLGQHQTRDEIYKLLSSGAVRDWVGLLNVLPNLQSAEALGTKSYPQ